MVETIFGWLEVAVGGRAEWRCFMEASGAQCVMTTGMTEMLRWCADNLDIHNAQVNYLYILRIDIHVDCAVAT